MADVDTLFDLTGKVCVVTGAGGALCGTMAVELAQRGAKVALLDINPEAARMKAEAIAEMKGDALPMACDVLDKRHLTRCCDEIVDRWGSVDLLITGAGGNDPRGTTDEEFLAVSSVNQTDQNLFNLDTSGFSHVFNLNFLGTFLTIQVFGKVMAEKGKGSILTISSMSADTPLTKVPAYSAAKAAVSNFTRWLSVHLAHTGIRVNALAPGFFMTEQLRFLHVDQQTGELSDRAKKVIAHTPLGRYGEPEDLIGTVVWLLSDASRFVTGTVVPVDGGFSAYSI